MYQDPKHSIFYTYQSRSPYNQENFHLAEDYHNILVASGLHMQFLPLLVPVKKHPHFVCYKPGIPSKQLFLLLQSIHVQWTLLTSLLSRHKKFEFCHFSHLPQTVFPLVHRNLSLVHLSFRFHSNSFEYFQHDLKLPLFRLQYHPHISGFPFPVHALLAFFRILHSHHHHSLDLLLNH